MTFTFIIMDSLYIMRNLLMIFFLMVVFWTNLGNCEGSCDNNKQCHYNETRMHSTVRCIFEKAGDTAHPCYGHGSKVTCSCTDNSYLCKPHKLEDGLHDLQCLGRELTTEIPTTPIDTTTTPIASPCDEPAPPDDLVFHSPDFAEGEEMYPHGTEIMYSCPEGLNLNGNMTAVCLYGVWTHEDAYCTVYPLVKRSLYFARGEKYAKRTEIVYDFPEGWDFIGNMTAVCLYGVWTHEDAYCTDSPCKDPAPANVDVIVTPQNGEDEGKSGSRVSYSCPNGFILHGSRSAVCLCGRWIVRTVPSCSAVCSKSTDCKSEQISACDIRTRSCACPPGKTFQNEKCLVERIIKSSLQLEVAYKKDFRKKSSCTFLSLEQEICKAFEETFTRLDDKFNNWFVSCEVEAIRQLDVGIHADVVTRYDEDVAIVNLEDFDTLIQSKVQSGLRLISITSVEESYNACEKGTDICDPRNGYCIYHDGTNYECRCKISTIDWNRGNPALHGIECSFPWYVLVFIIAIFTLFAVLLIWLVKKHCLRRGTKWIPSGEDVANEQVPNDESKFVSKITFEMSDPNGYQNDVNKEDNNVTDHVGDNSRGDLPNNDPEEETV